MKTKKKINRPSDIAITKRRVDKFKGDLIKGLGQILELPRNVQQYILFCLLCDETLYNAYTNSHINKYFIEFETNADFRDKLKETNKQDGGGQLWDIQLTPMIRGKIVSGLQDLIASGGHKKWEKVLSEITYCLEEGEFK